MDGKQLRVIQNAIQTRKTVVDLNQTWKVLHVDYQVGKKHGRQLHLSSSDLAMLEAIYTRHSKVSPAVNIDLKQNRVALIDYYKDEKIGGFNVFADQLVFASISAELPLKTGAVNIGFQGLLATTTLDQVDISAIKRLMIVENGAMINRLFDWQDNLSCDWKNSLFLYRGHGHNINIVLNLLENLPETSSIAFYGDLDPYGIHIATHLNRIKPLGIVVPKIWRELKSNHVDNNMSKHLKQIVHCADLSLDASVPFAFREIFKYLQLNQIAIMQENVNRLGQLEVIFESINV
ncbi:DUF7281 domain-containing protein [Acinetobacter nectaris]|uniref:DUF7281 domain-containing protein n=1 Tax=Acinetobacter nectaris TaxID=1219382 RepID=UPI001F2A4D9A|nr:hypothetical protein [Acinetobacter nectaris]MCF9047272.1 hypothetical protein [Acinetobacter nectaris]